MVSIKRMKITLLIVLSGFPLILTHCRPYRLESENKVGEYYLERGYRQGNDMVSNSRYKSFIYYKDKNGREHCLGRLQLINRYRISPDMRKLFYVLTESDDNKETGKYIFNVDNEDSIPIYQTIERHCTLWLSNNEFFFLTTDGTPVLFNIVDKSFHGISKATYLEKIGEIPLPINVGERSDYEFILGKISEKWSEQ